MSPRPPQFITPSKLAGNTCLTRPSPLHTALISLGFHNQQSPKSPLFHKATLIRLAIGDIQGHSQRYHTNQRLFAQMPYILGGNRFLARPSYAHILIWPCVIMNSALQGRSQVTDSSHDHIYSSLALLHTVAQHWPACTRLCGALWPSSTGLHITLPCVLIPASAAFIEGGPCSIRASMGACVWEQMKHCLLRQRQWIREIDGCLCVGAETKHTVQNNRGDVIAK